MHRNFGSTKTPASQGLTPKGPSEVTLVLFPLQGGTPLRASKTEDRELNVSLAIFSNVRPERDELTARKPVAATKSR
jgi:hypothetical protein